MVVFGLLCKTNFFGLHCCFYLRSVSLGRFGHWDFFRALITELDLGWAVGAVCDNFSSAVLVFVPPPAPQVGFHFGVELACVTSLTSKRPFLCCCCAGPFCISRCRGAAGNERFPGVMVCAAGGWQGWGWLLAPGREPVRQGPWLLLALAGAPLQAAATGFRWCGDPGSRQTG